MPNPRIRYIKDDNTDREFPDALECENAEFKVNGEYLCVEPCGGGSGQHLLGDQHIYVEVDGDDRYPASNEPIRTGSMNDPFATIQRAIDYIVDIVTIDGSIFIHVGVGDFYISKTIYISHPNRIEFVGNDVFSSSICFSDYTLSNFLYFWYGYDVFFFSGDIIHRANIASKTDSEFFDNLRLERNNGDVASNSTIGIYGGGSLTNNIEIEYFTFASATGCVYFGDLTISRYYLRTCSDGNYCLFAGGANNINGLSLDVIDYIVYSITALAVNYGIISERLMGVGAFSNHSYAFFASGQVDYSLTFPNIISKTLISSKSDAYDFGEMIRPRVFAGTCSDNTTGIICAGNEYTSMNSMESLAMDSSTITTNFGDNVYTSTYLAGCGDGTYGIFGGGNIGGGGTTGITIAIKSNSSNWANCSILSSGARMCSGG